MILNHLEPIKRKDFDEKMFGKKKNKNERILLGNALEGLPKEYSNDLAFKLTPEKIQIIQPIQKIEYNLSLDKVRNILYFNETEVEKIISQSAPGMIVGATTFGVLGAMAGGRVKTKEKKTVNHFVLIQYVSDSDNKEILIKTNDFWGAGKFVDYYKELNPRLDQPQTIEL